MNNGPSDVIRPGRNGFNCESTYPARIIAAEAAPTSDPRS